MPSERPATSVADVFAPPAEAWQRISPRLATVMRLSATLSHTILFGGAAVAVGLIWRQWWVAGALAVVGLVLWGWRWWRAARWVRAFGYAERDGDLCVTSGLAWRRLLVVPIGRLQVVKVSAGPVQKAFGLATVELVTASPQTNAAIPGLPADAAVALRDRLIEASDTTGSGL